MCYSAIYVFLFAIYVNVGHIWMTNNIYVSHKLAIYDSWEQTYMRQSCIYVEFSPHMVHVHTYMKEKRHIWIKDPFYICEMCDIYGKRSWHNICEHSYIYAILLFHICQTRVTYMSRFSCVNVWKAKTDSKASFLASFDMLPFFDRLALWISLPTKNLQIYSNLLVLLSWPNFGDRLCPLP